MKYVLRAHLKVLVIFLAVVTILRFEIPGSLGAFFNLVGLWVGGVIGMALVDLDRLIHIYIEHPELNLSQDFRRLVKEQKWKEAAELLISRRFEQTNLAFRNGVFAVVFIPVLFFANTSSAGLFGKGLASGVMLHFLYDAWRDCLRDRPRFEQWILWMVQREVPFQQKKFFLWGLTGVFGILTLFLL